MIHRRVVELANLSFADLMALAFRLQAQKRCWQVSLVTVW
jgi:hypothetical protein